MKHHGIPYETMFCMYYAGIVSMRLHPGKKEILDLRECAKLAVEMVVMSDEVFSSKPEDFLCRGLGQQ